MTELNHQSVTRRRVFYIPGYDPIHPRRYRELYRKESAAQAAISDYQVDLSPKTTTPQAPGSKTTKAPFGWHVEGRMEGFETTADIEVLVWSDIVRDSMAKGIGATYLQLLRTAIIYIGTGTLWRLTKLRKGPVIAALYPVAFLIVQALIGAVAAYGMGRLVFTLTTLTGAPDWVGLGAAYAVALVLFWAILRWFKDRDGRFFAYYLMHDYAYCAHARGANPPELEARLARFSEMIGDALTSEVDEVLVVGHSSGAHLGVSVLSDLIRAGRVPADGPALGLLSLGQVVPMMSFLPQAHRLRKDLQFLSERDEITWVDVTAPGDGCAFALCDPVAVTGVARPDQKWPLVISAAFTQTLSAERWKELRWRFFRLHFQYLCAFDAPGDYDYFRITAGPITLAERFAGRAPSRSRIVKPVNKFPSVDA